MRYLSDSINKDLKKKLVLLTGPRQSGKTTLSKSLSSSISYCNFDVPEERLIIKEKSWDKSKEVLILDELHKMKNWKLFLKGITDNSLSKMKVIVTGSAHLDIARKVGDSLAGRYYQYRLHPIDVKEAVDYFGISEEDAFKRILNLGGFPEPFLLNDLNEYNRWKKTHSDIIIKQDLIELETVTEIVKLETLIELLRLRVGSNISYANLAQDLEVAPKTVKRWLTILENLYLIFSVKPFGRKISNAIKKSPKYYFYDCGMVKGDDGAKFENLVALALKKEIEYMEDAKGIVQSLYYARNKNKDEIDFIILKDNIASIGIECKWSDDAPSKSFKSLGQELNLKKCIQLVANCERDKSYPFGVDVKKAIPWLRSINL